MSYSLLLLASLVAGVIGFIVRNRIPVVSKVLIVAACLGCAGTLGLQVRQLFYTADTRLPSRAHSVVGYSFANVLQVELAGRKGSVVLILPSEADMDKATAESYRLGFEPILLRGHPELEVQAVRLEKPPKGKAAPQPTPAALKKVIAKYPSALAFVCYAGVPANLDEVFPTDSAATVPWHMFDPDGTTNWLAALKKGQIQSVIVPRPGIDLATTSEISGLPGEIFSRLYLLATPQSADAVAAQLAKK